MSNQPEETGPGRVRAVFSATGKLIGFQDPDRGSRFISRADAVPRLRYSVEEGQIKDTFGRNVGVGSILLPGRGVDVAFKAKQAEYRSMVQAPERFTPNPNQEIIEKTTFVTKDGRLVTSEISWGLGKEYNPNKYGGRWRNAASEALGLKPGERLPTMDLKRAVITREYIVKTIT